MRTPNVALLVITSTASCGFIALGYYERFSAAEKLPAIAFYLTAAGICLLPVVHGLYRRKLSHGAVCTP